MTIHSEMNKQLSFEWGQVKQDNLPYFSHPKDDNERLLNYQHDMLVSHSKSAEEKLWLLSLKVTEAYIKTEMRKQGFRLSHDEIEDKKIAAVEYVLRRFSKTQGYFIKDSFTSALWHGMQHALWYRTKADKALDRILELMNNHGLSFDEACDFIRYEKKEKTLKKQGQMEFNFDC